MEDNYMLSSPNMELEQQCLVLVEEMGITVMHKFPSEQLRPKAELWYFQLKMDERQYGDLASKLEEQWPNEYELRKDMERKIP